MGSRNGHKQIDGGLTQGGRLHMEKLAALISSGKLDLPPLSAHIFNGFERIEETLFLMRDKPADIWLNPSLKLQTDEGSNNIRFFGWGKTTFIKELSGRTKREIAILEYSWRVQKPLQFNKKQRLYEINSHRGTVLFEPFIANCLLAYPYLLVLHSKIGEFPHYQPWILHTTEIELPWNNTVPLTSAYP